MIKSLALILRKDLFNSNAVIKLFLQECQRVDKRTTSKLGIKHEDTHADSIIVTGFKLLWSTL